MRTLISNVGCLLKCLIMVNAEYTGIERRIKYQAPDLRTEETCARVACDYLRLYPVNVRGSQAE